MHLGVFNTRRLQLVRFYNRPVDPIDPQYPAVDDRGLGSEDTIVGMMPSRTITVWLRRLYINESAPLRVVSTSPTVSVVDPADGRIPPGRDVSVRLQSAPASYFVDDRTRVNIQIFYDEGADHWLIHRMKVHVLQPISIGVTVHFVRIEAPDGNTSEVAPFPSIARMFQTVNAVWAPCGIVFEHEEDTVTARLPQADWVNSSIYHLSDHEGDNDLRRLFTTAFRPNRINIYFVPRIRGESRFTRATAYDPHMGTHIPRFIPHPGIVLAYYRPDVGWGVSEPLSTSFQDAEGVGRTLAHEIGHYLSLNHPLDGEKYNALRQKPASQWLLMHNSVERGCNCLIPMKRVRDQARLCLNDKGCTEARRAAREYNLAQ